MSNAKWLWSFIRQVKGFYLLVILLMLLETVSNLATIGLQKEMIDDVFVNGEYGKFWSTLVWIIVAYLASSLLLTFSPNASLNNVARFRMMLTKRYIHYMHKIPISVLNKERTSNYVNNLTDDLLHCTDMIGDNIPRAIQQTCNIILLMTIIGFASPIMLLAILVCCSIYLFLSKYFGKRLKDISREVRNRRADVLVHMEEGISSTREVIAYNRMAWELKIYNKLFKSYFDAVIREGKLTNKQMIASDPLRWGINIIVLLYGGYLVIQGALSIGMFIITYQFTFQLMEAFQDGYRLVIELYRKTSAVERLRQVMDGETRTEGALPLEGQVNELKVEQLTFRYNEQADDVLKGIDIDIQQGKKIAFVGTSGGGKSTIAQLLVRFYDPSGGRIVVNGQSLQDIRRDDWMKKLSIVFQEPYIFPDTIHNNLIMGLENVNELDLVKACKAVCIHDHIVSLPDGYNTLLGERGITLSGGQRQRLALARAVLRNSEILILDEATSALDLETERQIQKNLDELRKGKTTIIIAHRLSTVQNADIIYVMSQGQVAEYGTHEQLIENDNVYKRLVHAQMDEDQVWNLATS